MQRHSPPHHRRSAHRSDRLQRHVWAHHHGRPLWLRNSQRGNGCRGASTWSLPRRHARGSNSSHRPPRGRSPLQRGPGPCRRPASAASTILSTAAHRQSCSLSAHSRSTARWFPATATASAYTGGPSCRRADAIPLPQLQRQGALGERQRLPPRRRSISLAWPPCFHQHSWPCRNPAAQARPDQVLYSQYPFFLVFFFTSSSS